MTAQGPLDPRMLPSSLAGDRQDPPDSGRRVGPLGGPEASGRDTVQNPLPWFLRAVPPPQPNDDAVGFVPDESGVYPTATSGRLVQLEVDEARAHDLDGLRGDADGDDDWQAVVDEIAYEEERRFRGHGTTPMDDRSPDDELEAWALRCACLERAAHLADQRPDDVHRVCDLAEARLGLDAPRGAEAEASRAISLDPGCPRAYVVRATVRSALGDHDAALTDCLRALQLNPRSVSALEQQARVRSAQGDHAGAVTSLDLAIALCSRDHNLFKTRARARAMAGDLRGACEDATIAVAMSPRDGDALLLRGMLRRAGDLPGASSDVRRALSSRASE